MFKKLRILILLFILVTVALASWRANGRLTSWENTVHITIYPIPADNSAMTAHFIRELEPDAFADIASWMQEESKRYGRVILQPVALHIAPPVAAMPPLPPSQANPFEAIWWSLKLRWWAGQHDDVAGIKPQVRLFVLFHDPEQQPQLPHSTGLNKGQIGVIHAFSSRAQRRQNAVVLTHELLHTFGATDKYERSTLLPIYPQGYAEPAREPRYPQHFAEIMGGRTPINAHQADIPENLERVLIGPATAQEIGLLR